MTKKELDLVAQVIREARLSKVAKMDLAARFWEKLPNQKAHEYAFKFKCLHEPAVSEKKVKPKKLKGKLPESFAGGSDYCPHRIIKGELCHLCEGATAQ